MRCDMLDVIDVQTLHTKITLLHMIMAHKVL